MQMIVMMLDTAEDSIRMPVNMEVSLILECTVSKQKTNTKKKNGKA